MTAVEPAAGFPDHGAVRTAVLDWYRANGRSLAFRGTRDPWAILVSEFMAQQTQAARAAEAWERFLVTFPTPGALAASTPADVLRAWRGLGYNRRALALRAAAIDIVLRHEGRVPQDLASLDALPGVGPYTARAVAALAFGARVGAVDTNVRRVLGRVLFDEPPTERAVQAAADAIAPAEGAGEWTHAVMDVGATFCRSRNPRCDACPAERLCRYHARDESPDNTAADGADGTPLRRGSARSPGRHGQTPSVAPIPFRATSRWLRGRIVERLRDAPDDEWTRFDAAVGDHDLRLVEIALGALAVDGLVELRAGETVEARLSTRR